MKKKLILIGFLIHPFLNSYSQDNIKSRFSQNVDAITSLAWPVIVLIIFCVLYPHIKNIVKSRNFSIKVAGMELNVQNMADQLSEQIHELQKKTIELACEIEDDRNGKREQMKSSNGLIKSKWRVLWVTGKHENHAFEIDYLEKDGVEVIRAHSTNEAMEILNVQADIIDAVVTGVSRKENEVNHPQAGLDLLKKVKTAGFKTPVFVMCSEKSIQEYYQKLKDEGAIEATSSSLDLLAFLKGAGINCSRQLKANSNLISADLTRTSTEINLS
jgi:hypothetical protein